VKFGQNFLSKTKFPPITTELANPKINNASKQPQAKQQKTLVF